MDEITRSTAWQRLCGLSHSKLHYTTENERKGRCLHVGHMGKGARTTTPGWGGQADRAAEPGTEEGACTGQVERDRESFLLVVSLISLQNYYGSLRSPMKSSDGNVPHLQPRKSSRSGLHTRAAAMCLVKERTLKAQHLTGRQRIRNGLRKNSKRKWGDSASCVPCSCVLLIPNCLLDFSIGCCYNISNSIFILKEILLLIPCLCECDEKNTLHRNLMPWLFTSSSVLAGSTDLTP